MSVHREASASSKYPIMKKLVLTVALLALVVASSFAQITLVTYSFVGQPGNQTSTPVDVLAANVSATNITRGTGITGTATTNAMSSSSWTTNATMDLDDYYEFTLGPAVGYEIGLTNLVFGAQRSGTGPTNYAVRTSIDSFAVDLFTGTIPTSLAYITNAFTTNFVSLTNDLTIRIYGFQSGGGGGTFRLQASPATNSLGVYVTGSVDVVPEPSSLALLGLAALSSAGYMLRRRRSLNS